MDIPSTATVDNRQYIRQIARTIADVHMIIFVYKIERLMYLDFGQTSTS